MNKTETKSIIVEAIEKRFQQFLDDPDYLIGFPKLDYTELRRRLDTVKENYSTFIHYYVYRRHMRALKARRGTLGQETEKILVARGEEAVGAYVACLSDLDHVSGQFYATGVGRAIDRHVGPVFEYLPYNPRLPELIALFENLGVPNGTITWLLDSLAIVKYNLLRFQGMDGTFKGALAYVKGLLPQLRDMIEITRRHGLPVIQGAGTENEAAAGGGSGLAIMILIAIAFAGL